MSTAGLLELAAWILSAVIAGWLILDMVRVGRRHGEDQLIGAADTTDVADGQGEGGQR
jgi:uncharacterized membrane protein SpoIIM required for sporulation